MSSGLAIPALAFLLATRVSSAEDPPSPTVGQSEPAPTVAAGILPIPDYAADVWTREHLTGDWGGLRTDLANRGVQFQAGFNQYFQSVVDGGRDTGSEYGGHLDYLLSLDLMRMRVLPGALIKVRAETRYGDSVNAMAGPILPVNTAALFPLTDELDDEVPIALMGLNLTQFLSPKFALLLGKLDTLG